ncbi:UBX domain-containing protein 1-like [Lycorma delicatula]|uniref:UBX domain-containing protein 1-like n=1 Tax=Lycorma delicatula TaxID=130591 RepID=UPI003F50EBF3
MSSPFVEMLIEMGFSKSKAEKALSVTGNQGVEPAMEWLLAHAESLDDSETSYTAAGDQNKVKDSTTETSSDGAPSASSTSTTAANDQQTPKSLKCEECGKLFSTQIEVEFHAAKSGHSRFSESTEEKKPLTEDEKAEQLRKLEEKMKQKRKEREENEKLEALEREKNRIRSGKEMIAAKKKLEDEEIKKIVEQRKREKMEDKLARQRVKEQIEQDRLARKEKFGGCSGSTSVASQPPPPPPAAAAAAATAQPPPPPQKDYSQTRLQIRLTNGQALTHTFGAKEQLSAVRLYIELNRTDGEGPFGLMTNFPKKIFTDDDYDKPLDILGLVPSAVIIVSRTAA